MLKPLIYICLFFSTISLNAQVLISSNFSNETSDAGELKLYYNASKQLCLDISSQHEKKKETLLFKKEAADLLMQHIPLSVQNNTEEELEFIYADVNTDKTSDLIIKHNNLIGAGPQAGASFTSYYCFLNIEEQLSWNEDNEPIIKAVNELEFSGSTVHSIVDLFRHYHLYDQFPVGLKLDKIEAKALLLEEDERLILSVLLEGQDRITIAVDERQEYLVYRYSNGKEITQSIKSEASSDSKFHYYKEDNWGYSRYFLNNLSIKDAQSTYTFYENYVEGNLVNKEGRIEKDGKGLFHMDSKTKELKELKVLQTKGSIEHLKVLEALLSTKYECCEDYDDE